MAGIACLGVCRNCEQCCMGLYDMLGVLSYVVKLLNVAESDMDCVLCGRLWSE